MLDFCPQDIGAKEKGRAAQCRASGLSYKEAAQFFTEATPNNFQSHYNQFVRTYPSPARLISDFRPSGVGPGEMVTYFLFNNITVGGANATTDLLIDAVPFAEVKGGVYSRPKHCLYDFKLSQDDANSVKYITQELGPKLDYGRIGADLNFYGPDGKLICRYDDADFAQQVSKIVATRNENTVDSSRREHVVKTWVNLIFDEYLEGKRMALIQNDNLHMWYLGTLTKDMVGFYRLTRNQPKALVNLPRAESH